MNRLLKSNPVCVLINLCWVYVAYEICRFAFLAEYWDLFAAKLTWPALVEMLKGGWMFDSSAIMYTNALYCLLMLFPLHKKEKLSVHRFCHWLYVVVNGLCISINLADTVYFAYTGRRTTFSVFREFGNEGNLGKIIGLELVNHWYFVLLAVLLVVGLYRLYQMPDQRKPRRLAPYYIRQTLSLALFVPLCICGMRGGVTTAVRPIAIINANQYADSSQGAAAVMNTPFSMLRTIGKKVFVDPKFFGEEELAQYYSPLHLPTGQKAFTEKNVVVLIVESFGREYIGGLNASLEGGHYRGYTPFVDSLLTHSVTWEQSFCNGRKSIDGMPSILSSIPMFVEPFFVANTSTNDLSGLAGELGKKGYYSAFFHGADNGSMGFQAFARVTGYQDYFGRTEYNDDPRFGGDKDYDGTWAIWDEPFLQFMVEKMNTFQEPFVSTVFTASSHHPFNIPKEYKDIYPEEGIEMHKCIRYTDHALRRFFESAKTQPWYKNTLFVLTSDHTNQSDHAEYQTDLGVFCAPVILFDPSGDLQPGIRKGIAQQIDILPTVLDYLGYDAPFVAFGQDLLSTQSQDTWAVNYLNGIYQFVKGDYVVQFDGEQVRAVYDYRNDRLLQHNLKGCTEQEKGMEIELKAIIQSYMSRMIENRLIPDEP